MKWALKLLYASVQCRKHLLTGTCGHVRAESPDFLADDEDNDVVRPFGGASGYGSNGQTLAGDRQPLIIGAAIPAVSETDFEDESAADMDEQAAELFSNDRSSVSTHSRRGRTFRT